MTHSVVHSITISIVSHFLYGHNLLLSYMHLDASYKVIGHKTLPPSAHTPYKVVRSRSLWPSCRHTRWPAGSTGVPWGPRQPRSRHGPADSGPAGGRWRSRGDRRSRRTAARRPR